MRDRPIDAPEPLQGRSKSGKFTKGNKVGTNGRPPGKTISGRLREAVSEHFDEIVTALLTQARSGDVQAATLLLSRTCPAMRSISVPTPFPLNEGDLVDKAKGILEETSKGSMAIEDGAKLISSLAGVAKLKEIDELERRIENLEIQTKGAST